MQDNNKRVKELLAMAGKLKKQKDADNMSRPFSSASTYTKNNTKYIDESSSKDKSSSKGLSSGFILIVILIFLFLVLKSCH